MPLYSDATIGDVLKSLHSIEFLLVRQVSNSSSYNEIRERAHEMKSWTDKDTEEDC